MGSGSGSGSSSDFGFGFGFGLSCGSGSAGAFRLPSRTRFGENRRSYASYERRRGSNAGLPCPDP